MQNKIMMCIVLFVSLSMVGCTAKQESITQKETIKQEASLSKETHQEIKVTKENDNSIEKYTKLIGLSKEDIINILGEEPTVIDEGGLEFPNSMIRVWCIEDGETVDQIFIYNSEVDFNGAKLEGRLEDFKNVFGKPVHENTDSAYSNFDYEGLVLHVQYDQGTGKVFAVYLMKEWR